MEDLVKLLEHANTLNLALETFKTNQINVCFGTSWRHMPFKVLQVQEDYLILYQDRQDRDSNEVQGYYFLNPIGTNILYHPTKEKAEVIYDR